ncbi:DCC1-like thiol-disulfide oxidoreductase family protein [Saccharophagus degradans]|uniref:DCC1-like thiol-disulfide oxidoreductase family protein n=1 Tax=Saccharophagus degradans TaxID=86304 RepID=A0AAW7X5L8_9GAMM|nr:DCC1-like thiol-disulfide oxidoreductase family protein [Saccharophagus degradans]MDO6421931.1 DCC1-like thiol-disulfide oxidoreductase family protein [Saccharophagus degradans]MDO6606376.1 DCC1-like thiol-disulfide oxidoreductase family protein [Saccharophagus degradans]
MKPTPKEIWFVYDGECPICQMGATLFKVRDAVGKLNTVDARTELDHPVLQEINAAKLNLDEGMVIKYKDKLYQGELALSLMAEIGAKGDMFNGLNRRLFRNRALVKLSYPIMRLGRNIAITLKGAGKINNLAK